MPPRRQSEAGGGREPREVHPRGAQRACLPCCTLLRTHLQSTPAKRHPTRLPCSTLAVKMCMCMGFLCPDDLHTKPGTLDGWVRLGDAAQDPRLPKLLEALRASGRKLFLATNSLWDYTHVVMNFLLAGRTGAQKNMDWLEYFDAVITGAALRALQAALSSAQHILHGSNVFDAAVEEPEHKSCLAFPGGLCNARWVPQWMWSSQV